MSTTLRTIRLYGKLGARFGRQFRLAVSSPAEAVHALGCQIPGFNAYLMGSKDKGVGYAVFAGKRNLREDELIHPSGADDIRIAPVLLGAGGDGGVFNVILGAALVVLGTMSVVVDYSGTLATALVGAGVSMMVGGVMQMLAPSPKGTPQDRPENLPSYSFAGPVNTQAQGNPVPVLYGRMIVGSAVISAGIEAKDQAYIPTDNRGGGGGGGGSPPWHLDWVQQAQ